MIEGRDSDGGRPGASARGNPAEELRDALERCAVADASCLSRVVATGPDILDLLQRLGTNDVAGLAPGEGLPTVLTSPKGRVVHRLLLCHLGDRGILMIAGAGRAPGVISHLDRYTFAEETGLHDRSPEWVQTVLVGPRAGKVLERLELPRPRPFHGACGTVAGRDATVLGHDGLGGSGFSLVFDADDAASVRRAVADAVAEEGGRVAGSIAMEARRVLLGIPADGRELTEERNPLEAGLRDAVSFEKGCYVGQEVVARLNTYDKVARHLKGLRFPSGATCPPKGAGLRCGEKSAGVVASALVPPGWKQPVALAFVRRAYATAGTRLQVEEQGAEVVVSDLPLVG